MKFNYKVAGETLFIIIISMLTAISFIMLGFCGVYALIALFGEYGPLALLGGLVFIGVPLLAGIEGV